MNRVCLDLTPTETHDRYGGFTRYGLALLRHLLALPASDRADIELLVLARSDGEVLPAEDIEPEALTAGPVIGPERHRRQRRALHGRLSSAGVDLFHSFYPERLPPGRGLRVVANVYDLVTDVLPLTGDGWLKRVGRRLERWWEFRAADHLIAISEATRRDAARIARVPRHRIDVVHLAVDGGVFAPEGPAGASPEVHGAAAAGTNGGPARYFLAVGSDHYRKNQWRLFEAWLQVSHEIPENLVLVGRQIYGDVLSGIAAEAHARGLGERVIWLSDFADAGLPALYRGATALVAPSLYEGFGMTLLEAMACGTPVAASTAPSHREVAGEAALFFDPLSVPELSAALLRLSGDERLRARLRAQGLERARQFTWDRCARETLRVYRKVLGLP